MADSFVVGVTPNGKRHPLFVGTIGEARAFADAAKDAGGVVEETFYPTIRLTESVSPVHTYTFAAPPEPKKPVSGNGPGLAKQQKATAQKQQAKPPAVVPSATPPAEAPATGTEAADEDDHGI